MKAKIFIGLLIIPLLLMGCSNNPATTAPPTTKVQPPSTTSVISTATTKVTTSATAPTSTPPPSTTASVTPTKTVVQPTTNIPLISPEDLYNKYVKLAYDPSSMKTIEPNYATIDARGIAEYDQAHIPAAININPAIYGTDSEKQSIVNNLITLPQGVLLVFFDDNMDYAPGLAQQFLDLNKSRNLGYDPANVKIMSGGYPAWTAKDLPSLSSAQ